MRPLPTPIFAPALARLSPDQWGHYGPISFKEYLAQHDLPRETNTAQSISVQTYADLDPALRSAGAIVFRLGSPPGTRTTRFAVVQSPGRLGDFFLDSPTGEEPIDFTPAGTYLDLLPYQVFERLTENAMVRFAFASGLLAAALGLDQPYPKAAPATGASTFTFRFQAHSAYPVLFEHESGQVEIDAVFAGVRGGQETLFILESKVGASGSLAKTKLVYPVLALAPGVPSSIPIVPVYLGVTDEGEGVQYQVVECSLPDSRLSVVAIDQLCSVRQGTYRVRKS